MRKTILIALALAACTPSTPTDSVEPRSCSPSFELASDAGWRTTVCPSDSPAAWSAALAAEGVVDVDDLGLSIDWCSYDDAGVPTCGTAYIPPHPWCTGDEADPLPCLNVVCCLLTILNEGCGGCLDPEDPEDPLDP